MTLTGRMDPSLVKIFHLKNLAFFLPEHDGRFFLNQNVPKKYSHHYAGRYVNPVEI